MTTAILKNNETSATGHALQISSFAWNGNRYYLREPVKYFLQQESSFWIYTCPSFGLRAFERNRQEAFEQFHEEFAFLYDGLIDEPDANLTEDALEMKRKLSRNVINITSSGS